MKRRLLNLLTVLALLLCVAVASVWAVAGFVDPHRNAFYWPGARVAFLYDGHESVLVLGDYVPVQPYTVQDWAFPGFYCRSISGLSNQRLIAVWHWLACLILIVPVACAQLLRLSRRWKPRRAGTCRNCGYDLRATPDHCPECGTAATVPTPA